MRTAIGDFSVFGLELIQYDQSGPRIADIFELARRNGISLAELSIVRATAFDQAPVTPGGVLYRNSLVHLSLATEADIIASTEFKSRNAAEAMKNQMNEAFDAMEESAADSMDSSTYRALITLHAAVTEYCVTAQYPLPVMLSFRFAQSTPTLVQAYRLYDDASRADESEGRKFSNPSVVRAALRTGAVAMNDLAFEASPVARAFVSDSGSQSERGRDARPQRTQVG